MRRQFLSLLQSRGILALDVIKQNCKTAFLKELKNYSLEPRKNGYPSNSRCVYELINLNECDLKKPKHLAKLVKEGIHLMYQKNTAAKVIKSLLDNL